MESEMTIDEMKNNLEDYEIDIRKMVRELEKMDLKDIRPLHKHYIKQAIKLMKSAASYCEESVAYLNDES